MPSVVYLFLLLLFCLDTGPHVTQVELKLKDCQVQRKLQFSKLLKAGHVSRNELSLDYRRVSGS